MEELEKQLEIQLSIIEASKVHWGGGVLISEVSWLVRCPD